MHTAIEALSDTRRSILLLIKQNGGATIAEIAHHLSISDEGARQHLILLEHQDWVSRRTQPNGDGKSGRPASIYEISALGEEFFPKRYDELLIVLLDAVRRQHGRGAVEKMLEDVVNTSVQAWEARLRGKTLDQKLDALRDFYVADDPFTSVERNGHVSLVERNCPFMNAAIKRPQLCSITVNTLTRLLGVRVSRVRTFQTGDGCCEFRIHRDRPVDPTRASFELENPEGSER